MRFPDTMVVQRGVDLPPRLFTLDSLCDDRIVFTLPGRGFQPPDRPARPRPLRYDAVAAAAADVERAYDEVRLVGLILMAFFIGLGVALLVSELMK